MDESMSRQVTIAELELLADCYISELKCLFKRIAELKEDERRYLALLEYEEARASALELETT